MSASFDQLVQFLTALDGHLKRKRPVELYLVGGAAITLAYHRNNRTADLDFIDPPEILVRKGGRSSRLAKHFLVYVSPLAAINFAAPRDWKEQCRLLPFKYDNIRIKVPCAEDIVLGKLARLEPKDFEDIVSLYEIGVITAAKLLLRLRHNKTELRDLGYRNNARLLFRTVFKRELRFEGGEVEIAASARKPGKRARRMGIKS